MVSKINLLSPLASHLGCMYARAGENKETERAGESKSKSKSEETEIVGKSKSKRIGLVGI